MSVQVAREAGRPSRHRYLSSYGYTRVRRVVRPFRAACPMDGLS